ncbi:DUF2867 domain-containing protein [Rhizobium sp. AAP43]|uniref:DUF2867 domain-containing protein n=1 Tax=Rhizobium sp. AAP43 TaxID=1523420 RepID=UPI0006B8C635|nr:DUF2867 domain-containing protein [Rhizobium sp. AAP43]KPF44990.1 hypothetical protein IP76_09045 [Rhizobium sp. AAP43]
MSKVSLEPVAMPHPALPSANWADRYAVIALAPDATALDLARQIFGRSPRWVGLLLALRNRIVGLFGLKSAELGIADSQTIGAFPVVSARDDQVVLGFDDAHLNFRIVLDVAAAGPQARKLAITTLVERHNLFGRLYIFVITPFHKLIVRTMLARMR